jgi:hypothetical protein
LINLRKRSYSPDTSIPPNIERIIIIAFRLNLTKGRTNQNVFEKKEAKAKASW